MSGGLLQLTHGQRLLSVMRQRPGHSSGCQSTSGLPLVSKELPVAHMVGTFPPVSASVTAGANAYL